MKKQIANINEGIGKKYEIFIIFNQTGFRLLQLGMSVLFLWGREQTAGDRFLWDYE